MNKVVLLFLTGAVALSAQSCSFFADFADARRELEEETAKPIPVKVNTSAASTPKAEAETEEELSELELEEAEPIEEIAGLIPATNPDTRVRAVVRGRQDPFSVVTLTPNITIEEEEVTENENLNTNQNRFNNEANLDDDDLIEPPTVEVFEPTLAQDVVISGLYEAGGRTRLIVQAPEESNSRYVEVGQYLSNGQVLIKSIDRNHFPTPMVILEQSGVEVYKTIGDSPEDLENDQLSFLPLGNSLNQV